MAKKKEKEKTYKGEMTKYQAKRFLNPKSKRFWLTAAAPLLMVSGPLTEDHTVDSYSADTAEIDQTMTESMDKYVAEYLASTAVQDVYNEQVYQDRYDGDVSPELEAERNMQAAESRALRSVISNYMFDDDRMTEQQFAGYESILDQFDLGLVDANVEPYALKECKVAFNQEGSYWDRADVKECMTLDNDRDWSDVTLFGFLGTISSLFLAMMMILAGTDMRKTPKPRRKDFAPKSN